MLVGQVAFCVTHNGWVPGMLHTQCAQLHCVAQQPLCECSCTQLLPEQWPLCQEMFSSLRTQYDSKFVCSSAQNLTYISHDTSHGISNDCL